jgi:N-acetylmuramoyl-L-alanine amidase
VNTKSHFNRCGVAPLLVFSVLALCGATDRASGEVKAPIAKPTGPICNRAAFRVALDVGHTADVAGAKSARAVSEYYFNLRLAKEIEQALIRKGFRRTILLITAAPPRGGLFERAERANNLAADLFLSIHHDSVPNAFLEKWEYEGEEYGFSDRFKGHSVFVSFDNPDRKGSLLFARLLGRQLKDRGLQYTPHYVEPFMGHRQRELVDSATGVYRFDELVVLKYTHMPAVLLEAGSIINRDEELLLRTPERRALIIASVTEAVERFCAARLPLRKPPPALQASPGKDAPKPASAKSLTAAPVSSR